MMHKESSKQVVLLLGPAFVAAVAYVDPGNFAANVGAGSAYGYLLLWVLVLANLMAAYVQYLSAKLGLVTGKSLPELLRERLSPLSRRLFWLQAESVAIACDIAEVVGGALALHLLFSLPLLVGGIIVGIVSLLLLLLYKKRRQSYFERIIVGLLLVIPLGFVIGLFAHPPEAKGIFEGLIPRFSDKDSLLIATAMVGATIMPHVVYLHSALARDRHGKVAHHSLPRYLRVTKLDVMIAMAVAGTTNIVMLLMAATVFAQQGRIDDFSASYNVISSSAGYPIAVLFAVGLLVSGLASTAVGNQAGSVILQGLLRVQWSLFWRRVVTLLPALVVLALGISVTQLLIFSQIVLSFGVPFAVGSLIQLTSSEQVMGKQVNTRLMKVVGYAVVLLVTLLNTLLITTTFIS